MSVVRELPNKLVARAQFSFRISTEPTSTVELLWVTGPFTAAAPRVVMLLLLVTAPAWVIGPSTRVPPAKVPW